MKSQKMLCSIVTGDFQLYQNKLPCLEKAAFYKGVTVTVVYYCILLFLLIKGAFKIVP
jgi:hypothetical protein